MPLLFVIGLILIALCIYFAVHDSRRTGEAVGHKKRGIDIFIFALSLFSLIISLKLFWNTGEFADEYGTSPTLMSGGWFWNDMDWVRLELLAALCVISGIKLFRRSNVE